MDAERDALNTVSIGVIGAGGMGSGVAPVPPTFFHSLRAPSAIAGAFEITSAQGTVLSNTSQGMAMHGSFQGWVNPEVLSQHG